MIFIKNIQFTRLLKANGRLREFNFRKSNGLQDGIFTIDVSDDRGNRIVFHMHRRESEWKITESQVPDWVTDGEQQFGAIINEELLNESQA
jgi:hypothetical protein